MSVCLTVYALWVITYISSILNLTITVYTLGDKMFCLKYAGSAGNPVYMYSMGGLAEYCVVPAHGLTNLPDTLPYTESAIIGCAVFTAYGAMAHAAQVRPGDAIAVIGIGGVGSR